ncbi:hypothetical protein MQO_02660, partial [Staphylococcus aureus subsp. aureus VRS8]
TFSTVQKSYVFKGAKKRDKITVDFMVEDHTGKK